MRGLRNIYNLGVKELRSLLGDKAMLALIVFAFTISVYSSATVLPGSLHLAPIAIADMDQSQLSNRIVNSFYRPWFLPPEMITATEMDAGLDAGRYTFAVNIPPNFQRDVLAGRQPCPGYSLSRRRFEHRLAAVPDPAGDRRRVLPDSAVTLQKNDWHNGVNIIAGWRLRLIRPTNDRRASVGRASEAPPVRRWGVSLLSANTASGRGARRAGR